MVIEGGSMAMGVPPVIIHGIFPEIFTNQRAWVFPMSPQKAFCPGISQPHKSPEAPDSSGLIANRINTRGNYPCPSVAPFCSFEMKPLSQAVYKM